MNSHKVWHGGTVDGEMKTNLLGINIRWLYAVNKSFCRQHFTYLPEKIKKLNAEGILKIIQLLFE